MPQDGRGYANRKKLDTRGYMDEYAYPGSLDAVLGHHKRFKCFAREERDFAVDHLLHQHLINTQAHTLLR